MEETLNNGGGEESKALIARGSKSVRITGPALDANPSTITGMLNCGPSGDIAGAATIPVKQHGLWLLCEFS
ncbi:MAG TPA: hypothetical protein VH640_07665 [Bryobacteraceae bacterium]